jgi:hypothetical protein
VAGWSVSANASSMVAWNRRISASSVWTTGRTVTPGAGGGGLVGAPANDSVIRACVLRNAKPASVSAAIHAVSFGMAPARTRYGSWPNLAARTRTRSSSSASNGRITGTPRPGQAYTSMKSRSRPDSLCGYAQPTIAPSRSIATQQSAAMSVFGAVSISRTSSAV